MSDVPMLEGTADSALKAAAFPRPGIKGGPLGRPRPLATLAMPLRLFIGTLGMTPEGPGSC